MSAFFEKIQKIAGTTENEAVTAALNAGRPVMGYLCSYVPEEILHAAGLVPYRLRAVGSTGTSRADAYYGARNCSFVRHLFDRVLSGSYGFLSGMVFMNGCDHARRMYDNWQDAAREGKAPQGFLHMLPVPHRTGGAALAQYAAELKKLGAALSGRFGTPVTDESLSRSIALANEKRRLLSRLSSLRAARPAALRGSEFLALVLAVTAVPPEDAVALLTEALDAVGGRDVSRPGDVRVVLAGGCAEDVEHVRLIEDAGGLVTADNLCLGGRYFDGLADESGDPWEALARRYLTKLSCPRMIDGVSKRMDRLFSTVAETGSQAVLAEKLMFCDLWGGEIFMQKSEAKKRDVPFLSLERELYGGGAGQHATRIQAFFEKVHNLGKKNGRPV